MGNQSNKEDQSIPPNFLLYFIDQINFPVIKFSRQYQILYKNAMASELFPALHDSQKKSFFIEDILQMKPFLSQIKKVCDKLIQNYSLTKKKFPDPIKIEFSNPDIQIINNLNSLQIFLLPSNEDNKFDFFMIINCNPEIKKTKMEFEQAKLKLDSLMQASPLGIGETANNRTIVNVNSYLCNLLGYSEHELNGQNARIFYESQEEFERVGKIKHPMIKERGVGSIETQWKRKDGSIIDVFLSSVAKKNRDLASGIVFTALDITDLKKIMQENERARKMLYTVINTVPSRIFWKDRNSRYLGCNHSYAIDIGIGEPENIIGKSDFDFFPEDLAQKYRADDQTIVELKESRLNYMEHHVNSKGEIHWFRMSKVPLFDHQKNVIGILGTFEDITIIHESQKELAKVQEKLIHVQKLESLGRLAGGIAHEFNNVLTSIQGYADILELEVQDKDTILDAAKVISQNAKRGAQLTKELLGFARVGKYLPKAYNIHELIQNVIHITESSIPKKIKITTLFTPNTPICLVDQDQFELAITNILINARDAILNHGEIVISTSFIYENSDEWDEILKHMKDKPSFILTNEYVKIKIADNGEGMTDSVKMHLFEPFFTTKPINKGTGLGLPMVYGVVTNHGGIIQVESELKKGTTLNIYLPISKENVEENTEMQAQLISKGKGTILVIDDEENIRKSLKIQLESLGYSTILAKDGKEGLQQYEENHEKIDLILLDMVMPIMDGKECFMKIKELNSQAKIVIISGFTKDANIGELLLTGAKGFLQKPFTLLDISSILQSVLI